MSELNCAAYRDDLLWYAADQLTGARRTAIEEHLAQCADCRAEVAQWRSVATSFHRDSATAEAPPPTSQATWANIQAHLPPQPQLNGSAPIRGVIHMEFENDTQRVTPIKTRQSEQQSTPRHTRWLAAVATVLVVVLGIAVFGVLHGRNQGGGPGAAPPVTLPAGARLALPANWDLNSAAIVSENDIWSVGLIIGAGVTPDPANNEAYGGQALILHYTTGHWQVVSSGAFPNSALESIAMVSATEGWAVGFTDTQPPLSAKATAGPPRKQTSQPLILHYHNGAWKKVVAPLSIGTLYDVQIGANDEGVATGFDVKDANLVLHYKAGVWSHDITAPESNPTTPNSPDYIVKGASGILTYGDYGVYRLQGNRWQLVGLNPDALLPKSGIEDIAATGPNDVWALLINGVASSGSKRETKIVHFDGNTWAPVVLPSDILPAGLAVDRFIPHTTTWLDVSRVNNTTNLAEDLLVHHENNQWKVSNSPFNGLFALTDITATQSIAVGVMFTNGVETLNIAHYQNGAWS